jgi:hypothetical protein
MSNNARSVSEDIIDVMGSSKKQIILWHSRDAGMDCKKSKSGSESNISLDGKQPSFNFL